MLKFQAVAEKTAKKLQEATFLPHPVHLLMATFKDLHIVNNKNYKRWYILILPVSHSVSMCC